MNFSFKQLAVGLAAIATCACTSGKQTGITSHNGVITMNASAITEDASMSPAEKAEKLALMGEQLFTLTNFMYADELFDQSLALDPGNIRAQFYKSLNSTTMTLKGVMVRIKPMITTPEEKQKYDNVMAHMPNSGLKTFLLAGKEDIKTEKDVQAFADSLYKAQDKLREFAKANKNIELTLHLNDWTAIPSLKHGLDNCKVTKEDETKYDLTNCDLTHALEIKLNRADAEMIQLFAGTMELMFTELNSYDLSGTIAVSKKYKDQQVASKVIWQELSKTPEFATLRTPENLKRVITLGVDAVAAIRWAKSMQKELCPYGPGSTKNREGFLLSTGICIEDDNGKGPSLDAMLKMADLVLSGQPIEIMVNGKYPTTIAPTAFLNSPIADLKKLHPVFNHCDKVQAVSDDTLGGIFVNRDANDVLAVTSKCNE